MREAILSAAETLFSTNGFNAVSVRDIALAAGANPGSVTYHFKTKDGLLLEIYRRHCGPMNLRRSELLVGREARARPAGPAGGDRARLCAAGVLLGQRSCRRRRAVHAAARGDVGGRQRRGRARSSRRPLTTPATPSSTPSREPAASSRATRSSGAATSCSARSIIPW